MQTADLTSNFFALFDLPIAFDINLELLTSRYRELQRAAHPDKFANAADAERRLSVQLAARINEGLQILKDPLSRGRYLLELRGVTLNDAATTADKAFLLEQMELRERLDAIRQNSAAPQKLQTFSREMQVRARELSETLADCFQQGDNQALARAGETLRKLQFLRRIEQDIVELEEDLEDRQGTR